MAEPLFAQEQSRNICETLEGILARLDEAQMHVPAIHIHMALVALGSEAAPASSQPAMTTRN